LQGKHNSEQLCLQAARHHRRASYLRKQMENYGTCEAFISSLFFSLFLMSIMCFFYLSDSSVPLELSHALLYFSSSSLDTFFPYTSSIPV